jgi:cytochrome c oxidase subunit 1
MAMTDTRPAPEVTDAAPTAAAADAPGLTGWVTTSDHQRVGRLFVATSVAGLLLAAVTGVLLQAEGLASGLDILTGGSFDLVWTLHREALVLLFVVPVFVGVATAVVPAQVGSPEIAFPRGSATAYWSWLVSAGLLVAGYAADGGPLGGDEIGRDLYLLAMAGLAVSLCVGVASVLTTVIGMRAPGMTLLRTPLFSWSMLVGGGLLLLTLPVLVARVAWLYVTNHHGGDISQVALPSVDWLWSVPTVYLLAVPVAGVALEVVQVLTRRPLRLHAAGMVLVGLLGVVGIGAWAQDPQRFDEVLFVAHGLLAVLPALALLGLVADTARNGSPRFVAPLGMAIAALLLLLLGALAGAAQAIDALDLHGTTWETGQLQLVGMGAGSLGAAAAIWYWAPRLFRSVLSGGLGMLVLLLLVGGSLLAAVPNLANGLLEDAPERAADLDDEDLSGVLNGVSAAGGALVVVGGVLIALALVGAARRDADAELDPWGGHTLEWSDRPVEPVASSTPLLRTEGDTA